MLKALSDREIVIINVGANTHHSGLISPLYEDGSFFFMPIPEEGEKPDANKDLFPGCPKLPTYKDFIKDQKVWQYIRDRYLEKRVHNDPEFKTFTYGDNPKTIAKGKAANLKNHLWKDEGDLLFFFAGLTSIRNSEKTDDYHFYFIGFFEICDILEDVTKMPSKDKLEIFGENAHIKRGQANPDFFNEFWVWKGSNNSQLFSKAVSFDLELAKKILTVGKTEQPYNWPSDKSGAWRLLVSGTRTARRIMGDDRKRILLEQVLDAKTMSLYSKIP